MKKYFAQSIILLIVVGIFVGITKPVFAQNVEEHGVGQTQILIDPALELDVKVTRQDYPSKKFTVILQISSQINSGKVGVEWTYPIDLLYVEGANRDIISVSAGQITTFKKDFFPVATAILEDSPDFIRTGEIGIRVNAFTAERNYLSSTSFSINFNRLMEVLPLDSDYKRIKFLKVSIDWIWKTSLGLGILGIIIYLIRRFKAYLDAD